MEDQSGVTIPARALPRRTARWVIQWAERVLRQAADLASADEAPGERAGVGPDHDRLANDEVVRMWLRAWLQAPDRPSGPFEAALEAIKAPQDPEELADRLDPRAPERHEEGRAGAVTFADPTEQDGPPRRGGPGNCGSAFTSLDRGEARGRPPRRRRG